MSRVKLHCCGMEPVIIVPMRLGLILNRSIKDSNLRSGKLPVFASLPMHQSRIRLRIFGCKENGWCECYHLCQNFSTVKFLFEFVTHLQTFDFPSFILMAVSHNSFGIAIYMSAENVAAPSRLLRLKPTYLCVVADGLKARTPTATGTTA